MPSCTVNIQVQDVQEALGVVHSIPIAIRGEAYKIEVAVKYPQVGARQE